MNRTQPLETRCANGAACVEVVARVAAAEVARHELHLADEADRLLAAARRWAEVHRYGTDVGFHDDQPQQ